MADPKRPNGARTAGTRAKPKKTPGQRVLAVFKWIGIVAVVLAVIGAGVLGAVYATTTIPDPNKDFQTNVSTVYYRDGKEQMGTFIVQNRVSISYEDMPQYVKDALVAAENETFWTDPGISVPGLIRAVMSAVGPGDTIGGSTITQQYVKVLYLTQEKTLTRKLTEIIIALKVGQDESKQRILEGYLNTVYFGRGAYGIQAAAQAYFGKDAKELNLQQSIALVAIINSPGNLDPARGDKQRADLLERYQYTINQMVRTGKMTEAQKAEIYTTLPDFPRLDNESRFGGPKGYLLKMVQEELGAAGFSDALINGGGLQIVTTVDLAAQEAAVKAAQNTATKASTPKKLDPLTLHPAIASLDVKTGGIIALYGGPDYTSETDSRNWAITPRPTGSTFKPWALVAGLRDGASLSDTFNGNQFTPKGESKPITNAGGGNYGPVTLTKATTSSINSAYVDLVQQMANGPQKVIKAAEDAGLTNHGWTPVLSIPLGFGEVSPLEAARGLATLTNGGKRTTPHIVAEVKDAQGRSLFKPVDRQDQTIEADVARNAVAALTDVTQSGTGRTVSSLGVDVAGKTGTYYVSEADETRASWFIGSTAQISTAVVFTAGPQGTGNLDKYVSGFYGSGFPASTWLEYMKVAQKGLPKVSFPDATRTTSSGKFSAPPVPVTPTAAPTTAAPSADDRSPAPTPTPEPTRTTRTPTPQPSTSNPGQTVGPTPPGRGND